MAVSVYRFLWASAVVMVVAFTAGAVVLSGGWQAAAMGIALMAGSGVLMAAIALGVMGDAAPEPMVLPLSQPAQGGRVPPPKAAPAESVDGDRREPGRTPVSHRSEGRRRAGTSRERVRA
jgi:hypothetical protein